MCRVQETEDEQRNNLFKSKADISKAKQDKRDANSAYQIGKDLDGDCLQPTASLNLEELHYTSSTKFPSEACS